MTAFSDSLISQGLALNRRIAGSAANSVDWLFKRDTLIKSGRTWYELVHDGDLMAVRYYSLPGEKVIELVDGSTMPINRQQHAVPLVLIPPLGVTTETFDLMPQRSLVRYLVARGFRVYLVDWGKPKKEHGHLGLRDYSYVMMKTALEKVRAHSGSRELSMMGWCMGGLLCLLYQGQTRDKHVRNMVTVASPIDLESGSGVTGAVAGAAQALNGPAQFVSNLSLLSLNTLDPARLSLPPWLTTLVFKMTDPLSSITTYWDLVTRLSDREFVESHSTTGDYLNNMLMYPGGVLKDMASTVAGDNQLAHGRVKIADQVVELNRIRCNLLAFAGKTDNLVPPEVAAKIVDIVSSPDREFRVAPGGHMGVIIGSRAQSAVWAESADWLAQRSSLERRGNKPATKRARKAKTKPSSKKAAVAAKKSSGRQFVARPKAAAAASAGH